MTTGGGDLERLTPFDLPHHVPQVWHGRSLRLLRVPALRRALGP